MESFSVKQVQPGMYEASDGSRKFYVTDLGHLIAVTGCFGTQTYRGPIRNAAKNPDAHALLHLSMVTDKDKFKQSVKTLNLDEDLADKLVSFIEDCNCPPVRVRDRLIKVFHIPPGIVNSIKYESRSPEYLRTKKAFQYLCKKANIS